VRQRTRLKNMIHAIPHAHLVPSCPHADILGQKGRAWMAKQQLPADEQAALEACTRMRPTGGRSSGDRARAGRRSTGVNRGPATDYRPRDRHNRGPGNPRRNRGSWPLRQPGEAGQLLRAEPQRPPVSPAPAQHGRISKQGRRHARALLVESAWSASRAAGPLRAFFLRVSAKRGQHVAAVAVARKMLVIVWNVLNRDEDYARARPALHARKIRRAELKGGCRRVGASAGRRPITSSKPSATRIGARPQAPNAPMPGWSLAGHGKGRSKSRRLRPQRSSQHSRQISSYFTGPVERGCSTTSVAWEELAQMMSMLSACRRGRTASCHLRRRPPSG